MFVIFAGGTFSILKAFLLFLVIIDGFLNFFINHSTLIYSPLPITHKYFC